MKPELRICDGGGVANVDPDSITSADDIVAALRAAQQKRGYGSVQLDLPPSPYHDGIQRLRAANGVPAELSDDDPLFERQRAGRAAFVDMVTTARRAAQQPHESHVMPPQPYQLALNKLKERS